MSTDLETIWSHLEFEPGEAIVLSAIVDTSASPRLMAASVLSGPPSIAEGWPAWRRDEGFKPTPSEVLVALPGEFSFEGDGFVAGRVPLSHAEARAWISSVLVHGRCPAVGGLPEAGADLGQARAPIRVCTHSESRAGDLGTWLARPILGFYFPALDEVDAPEPADQWSIAGASLFNPGIDALGMSWFKDKNGPPPSGLLLGRFERKGWLVSQKLDPENDLYRVEVGADPNRAELSDLEIEVEEAVDGELIFAEHLRLEDTELIEVENVFYGPHPEEGRLEVGVDLPTLGRGVKRAVRLTHRDGTLLDSWESFNIVEAVSVNLRVGGSSQTRATVGETRGKQDLVELLGAVERVKKQYANLRRNGAKNRLFDDPEEATSVLRAILERAPGELLVLDPFFDNWSLLDALTGPPARVLIGPSAEAPPAGFIGRVRRWSGSLAPFHDRFFVWDGGGMSIGTSSGTNTNRLFRMARIGAAEAEVLRDRFALWWDDPGFEPVLAGSEAIEMPVRLSSRQTELLGDIENRLYERQSERGACVHVDPAHYVERHKVSVAEVLRDLALLDETRQVSVSSVQVEASQGDEETVVEP